MPIVLPIFICAQNRRIFLLVGDINPRNSSQYTTIRPVIGKYQCSCKQTLSHKSSLSQSLIEEIIVRDYNEERESSQWKNQRISLSDLLSNKLKDEGSRMRLKLRWRNKLYLWGMNDWILSSLRKLIDMSTGFLPWCINMQIVCFCRGGCMDKKEDLFWWFIGNMRGSIFICWSSCGSASIALLRALIIWLKKVLFNTPLPLLSRGCRICEVCDGIVITTIGKLGL